MSSQVFFVCAKAASVLHSLYSSLILKKMHTIFQKLIFSIQERRQ